jgi:Big-like domain-containing protein
MRVTRTLRWVLTAATLAGCGGGDSLLLPGAGEPASVTVLQGNDQNGRVGDTLPQPLVVAVADGNGRPVESATVVFVLNDPAPGAALNPDTAKTGVDGTATAHVVLGSRPGPQTGEVRALGDQGTPTATAPFTLTAIPEGANGIQLVSGDGQGAPVGSTLPSPLVVEVTDAFGNPIEGVQVSWTVDGGGSTSASATTTGADGLTSVTRTLGGTAGTERTFAAVDGLAGSPVTFVHTATAGAASGVSIIAGNNQTGPVSTELPQALVVEVRDAQNNAVPGVAVTWVIGTGGGSVTPSTSSTDASGNSSAAWTLGPAPGTNTVSAVVSGIGVAGFTATATAGAPARLIVKTQPSSSAVSGVALSQQPVVQLLDAQGNESQQAGVTVQVAIGFGGGTLGGTTSQPTDGNGRATFTDLVLSGSPGTRTLKFSATGFASVSSTQIVLAAAPTVTTITADSPDPSQAGQAFTVQFKVTSDAGTPTGSVQVGDGTDSCSGNLSGGTGSCALTLSTVGSRTLTATYAGADGFAGSSGTEAHTVEQPPAPPSAAKSSVAASPTTVTVGSTSTITVTVHDAADTPLSGRTVTLDPAGSDLTPVSATTDGNGVATFTFAPTTVQSKTFTATSEGITLGSATVTVNPIATTTTIGSVSPPPPAPSGTTVQINVGVTAASGTPDGQVTVSSDLDGTSCLATLTSGQGACTLQLTTVGTHTLTATYPATGSFGSSSGTLGYDVVATGAGT